MESSLVHQQKCPTPGDDRAVLEPLIRWVDTNILEMEHHFPEINNQVLKLKQYRIRHGQDANIQ